MPNISYRIERRAFANVLYQDTLSKYIGEVGQSMTTNHSSWLRQGLNWVVCDYSRRNNDNDVFRRAASIGYFWDQGVPNRNLYGVVSLATCIYRFLRQEGAIAAPKSSDANARLAIRKTIDKYLSSGSNRLISELRNVCAHHCVCSDINHIGRAKNKLCHH